MTRDYRLYASNYVKIRLFPGHTFNFKSTRLYDATLCMQMNVWTIQSIFNRCLMTQLSIAFSWYAKSCTQGYVRHRFNSRSLLCCIPCCVWEDQSTSNVLWIDVYTFGLWLQHVNMLYQLHVDVMIPKDTMNRTTAKAKKYTTLSYDFHKYIF